MAKILAFEKIYNYLNDEFESIKTLWWAMASC